MILHENDHRRYVRNLTGSRENKAWHNIFVNSAVPILQRSWVRILFQSSLLFFLTACNKMIFSSETWITMTKLYFYYLNSWMTSAREVTQYLQRQKRMSLLLRYEFEKYKMPFLVSIDYFRIPHNTLCLPLQFCMFVFKCSRKNAVLPLLRRRS